MSDLVPARPAVLGPSLAGVGDLHVVFRVAEAEYALPVAIVVQMESFSQPTSVPGGAPFLAGIMPIRGRVVPVIDLRVRFGLPEAGPTTTLESIVGQLGERTVALLADSAREVIRIPADALSPPPAMMGQGVSSFVKVVAQLGKRMILVLDFAKVIGEESIDAT